jgi:hypothetical protein
VPAITPPDSQRVGDRISLSFSQSNKGVELAGGH